MNSVTIDPSEGLLAEIGVDPIIKDDMPKISMALVLRAAEVMRNIDASVARMVRGDHAKTTLPRNHNYKDLLDRLTQPFPPEETQQIIDSFPPEEHELAGPFALLCQHAFEEIRTFFPVSKVVNFAGPKNIQPTSDRVWHFFNQLSVLNAPLRIADLIGSAALLKSQVVAMRSIYPTISQYYDHAIIEAVIEARAENDDYQLPPRAEVGVAVWRGNKVVPYAPPKPPEATPPANASHGKLDKSMQTVGQAGSAT